jgi:pimeloyl-ACP methyl ester carboxylesterase
MAAGKSDGSWREIEMAIRKRFWIPGVFVLLLAAAGVAFYLRPVSFFNAQVDFQLRATGAQSSWVTVSGYKVHYYAIGPENGKPLVLIHGLGGSAAEWHNLMPYLEYAGYRVYAPDLVGYGKSEQPADFSYSVADEASTVVGFLDALGLKRVDLGGVSMGGWIAQLIAAQHPERVQKLLLFDAVGLDVLPDWDTHLFTPQNPQQLDALYSLLVPNSRHVPEFVARDMVRISNKNAWVVQRALNTMWTRQNATDALLPQLKMPVLLVWGDQDRIVPLTQGQRMHQLIPQSKLHVMSGCGHLAHVQCADRIGPLVQDFLHSAQ